MEMSQEQKDAELFDLYSGMNDKEKDQILGSLNGQEVDDVLSAVERHTSGKNNSGDDDSVLGKVMSVLDYPVAPFRESAYRGIKGIKEGKGVIDSGIDAVGGFIEPLFEGPSSAHSGEDIAKELGFQSGPTDKQQALYDETVNAAKSKDPLEAMMAAQTLSGFGQMPAQFDPAKAAGLAIDQAAAIPGGKLAELAIKAPAGTINTIAQQDEMALRSTGAGNDIIEQGMRRSSKGTKKELEELAAVAKEKIISPFSTTEQLLDKVQNNLTRLGQQISEFRNKSADQIAQMLHDMTPEQLDSFLKKGFHSGVPKDIAEEISNVAKETQKDLKNFEGIGKSQGGLISRTFDKLRNVTNKAGDMWDKFSNKVSMWLNSDEKAAKLYIENGFHPAEMLHNSESRKRILNSLSGFTNATPAEKIKIMKWVDEELVALQSELKGRNPDINELADLKRRWQYQIDFLRDAKETPEKEMAYMLLQREANRAIDHEIDTLGKFVTNKDEKALHNSIKQDFGQYSTFETGLIKKRIKEIKSAGEPLKDAIKTPYSYPRVQTALAKVPDFSKFTTPIAIGLSQPVAASPLIEGFHEIMTQPVPPEMLKQSSDEISKSNLTPTQKAERMNLLNKHGRIYTGP